MDMIVTEIDDIVNFFKSEVVEQVARETGFRQRESKFGGVEFLGIMTTGLFAFPDASLGRMCGMAKDINPELDVRVFDSGIAAENVDDFLDGVDAYVDGLDYFAVAARRLVFAKCAELGIPATTAAPLGMGAAVLNFLPGRMTFEEYFRLEGRDEMEQLIRFLVGLSPAMLQRSYLAVKEAVDLASHKGPSTPMACEICAGMAGVEVLKILLERGKVLAAPWGRQFDGYRGRMVRTWRPGGNNNPLQRVAVRVARMILKE